MPIAFSEGKKMGFHMAIPKTNCVISNSKLVLLRFKEIKKIPLPIGLTYQGGEFFSASNPEYISVISEIYGTVFDVQMERQTHGLFRKI